jgi:hypothetical protein
VGHRARQTGDRVPTPSPGRSRLLALAGPTPVRPLSVALSSGGEISGALICEVGEEAPFTVQPSLAEA